MPPPALSVILQYYTGHEELLSQGVYKALGTVERVKEYQEHQTIDTPDFLNYFMIKRDKIDVFSTYSKRLDRLDRAINWMEEAITINGTINNVPGCDDLQEQIGEAVSLSVAGKLFGLIEADWARVPEEQGKTAYKTFDFEKTLMGITQNNEVIQIEAKGTFVEDNTIGQDNVYAHVSNIKSKKKNIRGAGSAYPYPATALYGMIASIDPNNPTKCWLLDPPALPFEGNLRNQKIATRLEYIAALIEMLAPKAKLPIALRDSAANWRGGEGGSSVLDGSPYTRSNYVEKFLARNKIWLSELDVVGEVYVGESDKPFFFGVNGDLVRASIQQDGDKIASLRFAPSMEVVTIVERSRLIKTWEKGAERCLTLQLFRSSAGVVIGIPCTRADKRTIITPSN